MMLKLENISLGFKDNPDLISDANLEIPSPSLIPLFGKNGSGKSVLLKTISGLLKPKSGLIWINSNCISSMTPSKIAGEIAFMSATPPSLINLTCEEIVLTGRQRFISGINAPNQIDLEKVELAMMQTGILSIKNHGFGNLSDGTKQKVMLARCLAQDSSSILLDEPLAFLDYPTRIEFLQLLKNISTENRKLILYTSHDLGISIQTANSILAIKDNRLHRFENPNEFSKEWLFPNPQ